MFKVVLLAVISIVCFWSAAFGETIYVSGEVSGSWDADTVMVTGAAWVPSGMQLTIAPGTAVLFENINCDLTIRTDAVLSAIGDQADTIVFDQVHPGLSGNWGGIKFDNSSADCELTFCRISHVGALVADDRLERMFGALDLHNSYLEIEHCVIESCFAVSEGAAIYGNHAGILLRYSNIKNNLCNQNGFSQNYARGGGISIVGSSFAIVNDCSIIGNIVDLWADNGIGFVYGGGLYADEYSSVTISNSLIANNSVYCSDCNGGEALGGGVRFSNSSVYYSTITENSAHIGIGNSGGFGIECGGDVTIGTSIVWGNDIENGLPIGGSPNITYSDIEGGFEGEGNINVNPLFCGPDDYWLAENSPCVDAGQFGQTIGAFGVGCDSIPTGIADDDPAIPKEFGLRQNFPNPFNSSTIIYYSLQRKSEVKLVIYNLRGQNISVLIDDYVQSGEHHVAWDATGYSSGIYFYKLTAGDKVFTKRMSLIK